MGTNNSNGGPENKKRLFSARSARHRTVFVSSDTPSPVLQGFFLKPGNPLQAVWKKKRKCGGPVVTGPTFQSVSTSSTGTTNMTVKQKHTGPHRSPHEVSATKYVTNKHVRQRSIITVSCWLYMNIWNLWTARPMSFTLFVSYKSLAGIRYINSFNSPWA